MHRVKGRLIRIIYSVPVKGARPTGRLLTGGHEKDKEDDKDGLDEHRHSVTQNLRYKIGITEKRNEKGLSSLKWLLGLDLNGVPGNAWLSDLEGNRELSL
ncbi:hypothetical protein E2C01_014301 [Portunus trituberculatus]|uniref:Uncharacterized protein n=1 Tax=Portunus trituberculatus TaxID=210409 RepID=A0A5B7DIU1_PORTR|nr:hypothetical protein [Portunus trituberculatus]